MEGRDKKRERERKGQGVEEAGAVTGGMRRGEQESKKEKSRADLVPTPVE